MEQFGQYRIHIFTFDTNVYNYDVFTHEDGRDIREYEIIGGGGTDFMCCWNYMKENNIHPEQFIMFTDGMPWNSWGDPEYCDTLFLIHDEYGRGAIPEAPFGVTVKYEKN
jgi:predicted metal-dependent peptidase